MISPTLQAFGILQRTLLSDVLVLLNTALLVLWLKYREHLFRDYRRQGSERTLFYFLASLSVIWIAIASVERRSLATLDWDEPILGLLIRSGAGLVLIAYMSLWGHVTTEPNFETNTTLETKS